MPHKLAGNGRNKQSRFVVIQIGLLRSSSNNKRLGHANKSTEISWSGLGERVYYFDGIEQQRPGHVLRMAWLKAALNFLHRLSNMIPTRRHVRSTHALLIPLVMHSYNYTINSIDDSHVITARSKDVRTCVSLTTDVSTSQKIQVYIWTLFQYSQKHTHIILVYSTWRLFSKVYVSGTKTFQFALPPN